jgi:hypothetical protein
MGNAWLTINNNGGGTHMFKRNTSLIWIGILVLSACF